MSQDECTCMCVTGLMYMHVCMFVCMYASLINHSLHTVYMQGENYPKLSNPMNKYAEWGLFIEDIQIFGVNMTFTPEKNVYLILFLFIIDKIYWKRGANLTFCCVMFDSQFCPLAMNYKNLAVKYKKLIFYLWGYNVLETCIIFY